MKEFINLCKNIDILDDLGYLISLFSYFVKLICVLAFLLNLRGVFAISEMEYVFGIVFS